MPNPDYAPANHRHSEHDHTRIAALATAVAAHFEHTTTLQDAARVFLVFWVVATTLDVVVAIAKAVWAGVQP